MSIEVMGFFLLATFLVGFSLLVILARNPVHSALALVAALFIIAVLFLTLDAPLVAALQILVYAGAIMVLFLFVVMLLNPGTVERGSTLAWGLTATASGLLALVLIRFMLPGPDATQGLLTSQVADRFGSPEALGQILFNDFALSFEVASILLLVAIVGAVTLAGRIKA
jgi:NADH-quinone oxidoreductase subunit J